MITAALSISAKSAGNISSKALAATAEYAQTAAKGMLTSGQFR
jgi:hypothetical protein